MEKVITKELLSQVLRLESHQQEKVLYFIKGLLEDDEMNKRAQASENAIEYGDVKSLEDFNSKFENWKASKRKGV